MRRQKNAICPIVFAISLFTALGMHAQTPGATPAPPPKSLEKEFFKNILHDQKTIWTAPFHLHRVDAKWMIPSSIGAMTLFTTDRITGDQIRDSHRQVKASQIVSYAGSVYGLGAVATTFYLIGRKKTDDRARETGILSAEALVDSLIVSGALKEISQRARPLEGRERSEFFDGGNSFPSGHSVQVWSVAAVIANEYHDRQLIKLAAYGIAGAVSVARFTERKHYISDVVVGSAAGYAIGRYVYKAHHRDPSITQSHWPAIVPQYSRSARQYGVGLTWSF
jgi:hypothetical protein